MGAEENRKTTEEAYAAFSAGDAEGAMRNMHDSIEWTTRGDHSLSGTRTGKQEVGELWGALAGSGFSTEPQAFIADGDTVIVLATVTLDGETVESADVLTYDSDGMLVGFDTRGDPAIANRVFAS